MRTKKFTNHPPILQTNTTPTHTKLFLRPRLINIRSLEAIHQPIMQSNPPNTLQIVPIQTITSAAPNTSGGDYQIPRRQRQILKLAAMGSTVLQKPQVNTNKCQSERSSQSRQFLHLRNRNPIRKPPKNPQDHSQQKIHLVSAQSRHKSYCRSQNTSAKKRTGIALTQNLLKRISGMYTDNDFQNTSTCLQKTQQCQTTGMSTTRGAAYEEYQINELDFLDNNHTLQNSNHHSSSFNDSAQWTNHFVSQQQFSQIIRPHQNQFQKQLPKQHSSEQQVTLSKIKSCEALPSRPLSRSFEVDLQPPSRHQPRRFLGWKQNQKYVIHSKGKTLQQLSVKQSFVLGFQNYYQ